MCEPYYKNRISITDAYNRFKILLNKHSKKTKTKKTKKKSKKK